MGADDRYQSILRAARGLRQLDESLWVARGEDEGAFSEPMHAACYDLEESSFWFAHRNACLVEAVRRSPPPGPIVDIGAGNGVVTRALRSAGFDALALEPGHAGARNAVARGLSPVINASLLAAGFEPHSLPAVGLFDVLEHLPDEAGALNAVAAALRPDGRLYLTVPAYGWLWSDEDVAAGHHRRYTARSVEAALSRSALAVERVTYFFAPLPPFIFAARSVPARLGLHRSAEHAQADHHGRSSLSRTALSLLLAAEVWAIRSGRSLPFGSSLLVVARPGAAA